MILPRSDFRFPSRRVRLVLLHSAPSVSLSCQGGFWWSFPFLSRFLFCSSDSFASKVPLGTWSPFGLIPTFFGVLSIFVFWLFPDVCPFPLLHVAFALLLSLPYSRFPRFQTSVSSMSFPQWMFCLLFVFYTLFGVLSSLVGHSSSVPLPMLSLGA